MIIKVKSTFFPNSVTVFSWATLRGSTRSSLTGSWAPHQLLHTSVFSANTLTLNVDKEVGEGRQANKRRTETGDDVRKRNSLADDVRPGACFVSMRELSPICQLAPRDGAKVLNRRCSRDIIKNLGGCT